jgi:hypothetical protein
MMVEEHKMTDGFDEIVARINQVNEVIEKLDDAIKSQAFDLFKPFISRSQPSAQSMQQTTQNPQFDGEGEQGLREFIGKQESSKPSDNVHSIVAWYFSRYGIQPFKTSEVASWADEAGVTTPTSLNMTLTNMSRGGKKLLQKSGGTFRVNVYGEKHFKEKYAVSKGTTKRNLEE